MFRSYVHSTGCHRQSGSLEFFAALWPRYSPVRPANATFYGVESKEFAKPMTESAVQDLPASSPGATSAQAVARDVEAAQASGPPAC
ncbi:hypothetical protein [Streptomyces sp. NPDC001315]|uniref:hypothetical protein n=1 Tax=Streptomyces sp. NPDC001315 TaxID=3364562 RepID=UPI0036A1AB4D